MIVPAMLEGVNQIVSPVQFYFDSNIFASVTFMFVGPLHYHVVEPLRKGLKAFKTLYKPAVMPP